MINNNLRVHVQIVYFESSLWEFTLRVYFRTVNIEMKQCDEKFQ